jgi:hypothetical protein
MPKYIKKSPMAGPNLKKKKIGGSCDIRQGY